MLPGRRPELTHLVKPVQPFSGIKHLEALKETGVRPVVNQLELHPWCQQREIVKYCRENGKQTASNRHRFDDHVA
jgi:diketogulonate reductase-like aldo/keto reductase